MMSNHSFGITNQFNVKKFGDKVVLRGFVPAQWSSIRIQGMNFVNQFGTPTNYDFSKIDTVVSVQNGQFNFIAYLKAPKFFMVNGAPAIDFRAFGVIDKRYAGFHLLVEPGDSLVLLFADDNKKSGDYTFGLNILGRGAEKFWCAQQIVNNVGLFKYPKYRPRFDVEYVGDKVLLVDSIMKVSEKVLNTINLTVDLYRGHISENAINILKAQYIPMLCYDIDEFFLYPEVGLKYDDKRALILYNKYTNLISNSISIDSSILYSSPHGYKELICKKMFVKYCLQHPDSLTLVFDKFSYGFYKYIMNSIDFEPLRAWVVCHYLWKHLFRNNESESELNKAIEEFVKDSGKMRKESVLKEILKKEYIEFLGSVSGSTAYNFNLPDTNMVFHKLTNYRGKLVLIDFMFTGCRGCTMMVPILKEIEEEFKSDSICFISISISGSDNLKTNLNRPAFVPGSLYLFTENKFQYHPVIRNYNIITYPTLVLIGKDGKIIKRFKNILADDGANLRYILNKYL